MKHTIQADPMAPYFETPDYSPTAILDTAAVEMPYLWSNEVVLDGFLATVKWLFLYLPGTATIHFSMMAFSLFLFYNDSSADILIGTVGIFMVSLFMVMLGLGKFNDLRYLRVVGALVAAGGLASIVYSILTILTEGDFFGWFTLFSFPFTLLVAQLVKKNTDLNNNDV